MPLVNLFASGLPLDSDYIWPYCCMTPRILKIFLCLWIRVSHLIYHSTKEVQHLINSPISCQSLWSFLRSLLSSLWENQYSENAFYIMLCMVLEQILSYAACSWKTCYPHERLDDFVKNTSATPVPCSQEHRGSTVQQGFHGAVNEDKGHQPMSVSYLCFFPPVFLFYP